MGIAHHRKRNGIDGPIVSIMGGGLVDESLTDLATDGDIAEHETGKGPGGLMGDVDLDYNDLYGAEGTRGDIPFTDPYTVDEAREDMSDYAVKTFRDSRAVRDVAEEWQSKTVTFNAAVNGLVEPYFLAGADPQRKSIYIRNISVGSGGSRVCDAWIGNDPSPSAGNALTLRGGFDNATTGVSFDGQFVTMTHRGDVWVKPAFYAGVTHEAVTLTYAIEKYV